MPNHAANVQLFDFTQQACGSSAGHDYTVAILLRSGAAEFSIDRRFTLQAGDLYVIPAGAPHAFLGVREAGTQGWGFQLSGGFERLSGRKTVTSLADQALSDLDAWLSRIHLEQQDVSACSLAMRGALYQAVHIECARVLGVGACAEQPALVRRALEIINTGYAASLRPRDIAARIGVTPSHLSHELQRLTGRSPSEWITHTRLEAAKLRLLSSREPVSAVAEAVGYTDVSQLNRRFRQQYGISPRGWRLANAN
jgi:AraC-like DNA-binding protein